MRSQRPTVLIAFDAIALVASYLLSTVVRYDGLAVERVWVHALVLSGVAVVVHLAMASYLRVYRGRYGVASIDETIFLGLAASVAGVVVTVANAISDPLWLARSIPLSATFFGLFLMLIARAVWRYQSDRAVAVGSGGTQRAIVVGAGATGSRLAQSMRVHPDAGLTSRWLCRRRPVEAAPSALRGARARHPCGPRARRARL